MVAPFEGVSPASGREHAAWVVDTLREWGTAAHVVPDGFPAYARIHHRLLDERRWADVAPDLLGRGPERYSYPYAADVMDVEGSLPDDQVDALVVNREVHTEY